MNDKKNLQCSRQGSYYLYFDKSVVEKAYHWQPMKQLEIEYDAIEHIVMSLFASLRTCQMRSVFEYQPGDAVTPA